jgi:hypothetical protein
MNGDGTGGPGSWSPESRHATCTGCRRQEARGRLSAGLDRRASPPCHDKESHQWHSRVTAQHRSPRRGLHRSAIHFREVDAEMRWDQPCDYYPGHPGSPKGAGRQRRGPHGPPARLRARRDTSSGCRRCATPCWPALPRCRSHLPMTRHQARRAGEFMPLLLTSWFATDYLA